jgi:hypothetical protein
MIWDLRNEFCSERLITVTQKRFKGFEIDEVSWEFFFFFLSEVSWELIEEGTDLAREWG